MNRFRLLYPAIFLLVLFSSCAEKQLAPEKATATIISISHDTEDFPEGNGVKLTCKLKGMQHVATYGFRIKPSFEDVAFQSITGVPDGENQFSAVISGLSPDEEYQYWAFVSNGKKENRSLISFFTTRKPTLDPPSDPEPPVTPNDTVPPSEPVDTTHAPVPETAPMILKVIAKDVEDNLVMLPFQGLVDGTIDWGDGQKDTIDANLRPVKDDSGGFPISHRYAAKGEYTVTFDGTLEQFCSYNLDDPKCITEVIDWGTPQIKTMYHAFYFNSMLKKIARPRKESFRFVTSFKEAFSETGLEEIPCDLLLNAPNATDFDDMFSGAQYLTSVPDSLFSHCGEIKHFGGTFQNCISLTSLPCHLFANCSQCEGFDGTFRGCNSLTEIPAELFSDCVSTQRMYHIFDRCTGLTQIPSSLFSTCHQLTDLQYCFSNCYSLIKIPGNLLQNNTDLRAVYSLFSDCKSLTAIPSNLFDHNRKIVAFNGCFSGCTALRGESPYTIIDGKKVHLWERVNYPGEFRSMNDEYYHGRTFQNATGLNDYDQIPDDWK